MFDKVPYWLIVLGGIGQIFTALIYPYIRHRVFDWYTDLRRFGSVPHAGFGLGLERTVAWICGLNHVRETIAFPRMMGRITP